MTEDRFWNLLRIIRQNQGFFLHECPITKCMLVRAGSHYYGMCPICAVWFHLDGNSLHNGQWAHAANGLGLERSFANRVMCASEDEPGADLRYKLLVECGIFNHEVVA